MMNVKVVSHIGRSRIIFQVGWGGGGGGRGQGAANGSF